MYVSMYVFVFVAVGGVAGSGTRYFGEGGVGGGEERERKNLVLLLLLLACTPHEKNANRQSKSDCYWDRTHSLAPLI